MPGMRKGTEDPVRQFLSQAGRKGGCTTLKKHGRKKMHEWGKLGGRPRRNPKRKNQG
jgi:general stress protein YciG